MRIAVMGAGAVGGYFGARLAAAGADVAFLARGRHLAAILNEGLRIDSEAGDLHLQHVRASDEAADIGPVDVVLFTVKLWDTESAAAACRPLVRPGTVVIGLQNGVTGLDVLGRVLGVGHVAGGVAHIGATIAGPGLIRHTGLLARIIYGALPGTAGGGTLAAFHELAQRAEFDAVLSDDIRTVVWEKFAFLAPFSGITALTRQPAGVLRAVPETRALFLEAVREVVAVGRARGVPLDAALPARIDTLLDGLAPAMRSSMLNDLERGGRLELPWLSGAVAAMGAELGVPTPVHHTISAALAPYRDGRPDPAKLA